MGILREKPSAVIKVTDQSASPIGEENEADIVLPLVKVKTKLGEEDTKSEENPECV